MEGLSCQEQVEQSILLASWTVSHRDCVMETKLEWEPVITPAYSYNLDSRPVPVLVSIYSPVSLDTLHYVISVR